MTDWENELKKYLSKKFEKVTGVNIPLNSIHAVLIDSDLDIIELSIDDLANMYAFAIMRENFEQANKIKNELLVRDCEININIDDTSKTGEVYLKPNKEIPISVVYMKVLSDGMIIDFEKQNL
jgi:hypothetical protein